MEVEENRKYTEDIETINAAGGETLPGSEEGPASERVPFLQRLWKWLKRLVKPMHPVFKRLSDWFGRNFGKKLSPSFFVMLALSSIMWLMIKMGYTYVAEIPVRVNIEGHEIKVTCVVEGEGYNIFANRNYKRRGINLKWSDLEVTPSAVNPRAVVISPYSLQNAISVRKPDMKKIISVGSIPEVEL